MISHHFISLCALCFGQKSCFHFFAFFKASSTSFPLITVYIFFYTHFCLANTLSTKFDFNMSHLFFQQSQESSSASKFASFSSIFATHTLSWQHNVVGFYVFSFLFRSTRRGGICQGSNFFSFSRLWQIPSSNLLMMLMIRTNYPRMRLNFWTFSSLLIRFFALSLNVF